MQLKQLGNPVATGNTAHIYRLNEGVVKLFHSYLPADVAKYEGDKQRIAHAKGIAVPEVWEITEIEGQAALIMSYAEGKPIGEHMLEHAASLAHVEQYFEIFVDQQIALHRLEGEPLEPMEQKLAAQLRRAARLEDKTKEVLLNKLGQMKYHKVVCHGDLHPHNILLAPDGVTIIDWVDAAAGDLRADVYRTYLLIAGYSTQLAELYLQLYCSKTGLAYEEIFQWAAIIAGARLGEHHSPEEAERLLAIVKQFA